MYSRFLHTVLVGQGYYVYFFRYRFVAQYINPIFGIGGGVVSDPVLYLNPYYLISFQTIVYCIGGSRWRR